MPKVTVDFSKMTVGPCPFCKSRKTYLDEVSIEVDVDRGEEIDGYQAVCRSCEAMGPFKEDDSEAIKAWKV